MIVDTSAVMAILNKEPEAELFFDLMIQAPETVTTSAGSWVELGVVLVRRKVADFDDRLSTLMAQCGMTITPVTVTQADLARDAYRRYGRGTGHPAKLNFGDCFAYALARERNEPLLFKGDDFNLTDVIAAA